MSETKETGVRKETPEERARRIRRQRRKREELRRRRRKALILRAILAIVTLILIVMIVVFAVGKIRGLLEKGKNKKTDEVTGEEIVLEAADTHNVLHLSFQSLIADPGIAFGQENTRAAESLDQSRLTVDEFNKILEQLYQQGYMLVSLRDLAAPDEESVMREKELLLPKGKKPLILSQQNVSYDLGYTGQGIASRLILDENGQITSEKLQSDGTVVTGAYDVITCVNAFVEAHPDFSNNGAKGIIGVTGYNGLLGYRTEETLASNEGNRYAAQHGVFNTEEEREAAKPVIEALRNSGWEFACNGYGTVNYTSGLEDIKGDMEKWKAGTGALLGDVDILMYPSGNDIGNWSVYTQDDQKYAYLKEQGFRYFCGMDISGAWSQLTEEYLRCNYRNLDGYRMYQDLYQGAGRFQGLLDFTQIYDQTRPSAVKKAAEGQGEGVQTGEGAPEEAA